MAHVGVLTSGIALDAIRTERAARPLRPRSSPLSCRQLSEFVRAALADRATTVGREEVDLRFDYQYQTFELVPPCPEVESVLGVRAITVRNDPEHGYRIERERRSLRDIERQIPHAGLGLDAAYLLILLGYEVHFFRPFIAPVQIPNGYSEPNFSVYDAHVTDFLRKNYHGIITHRLNPNDLATLCFEIAHATHAARIAFVTRNNDHAHRLHAQLAQHVHPLMLTLAGRCENPDCRIAVATPAGLGNYEAVGDRFDIILFLDAVSAVGEFAQLAVLANGRSRIFGLLREDVDLPPRIRDLLMATFGPREVSIPKLGYQRRQVAVAWTRSTGGTQIPGQVRHYEAYRLGIVRHRQRNKMIAQLAAAFVDNDAAAIASICPAALTATNKDRPRNNFGDLKRICWEVGEMVLSTRRSCDESLPGFGQASHEVVV